MSVVAVIRTYTVSKSLDPVGLWCQNDVVSTRCDVVTSHRR